MAPRRSARLRGGTEATETPPTKTPQSTKKLDSVLERDESSTPVSKKNSSSMPATPANKETPESRRPQSQLKSAMKTPKTSGNFKPALDEMHPSKVQQSTSKQPNSGLVLGFHPIQKDSNPSDRSQALPSNTPSKTRASQQEQFKCDFKFSGGDSQLSDEARKLMENVREDAARIKAQMVIERGAQESDDADAEGTAGDRKIAKPKGKASRFSQAHMAQFKKMDSIAGHASSFRAARDNEQQPEASKSLKRTISKAKLNEPEKAQPSKSAPEPSSTPKTPETTVTKRRKVSNPDKGSTRLPLSQNEECSNRNDSNGLGSIPGPFATPQKKTLAHSASAKQFNTTTKIPAISQSPSLKSIRTPRTPQTDFKAKLQKGTESLSKPRSILRRRQPLFSNDPVKIAAGTHMAAPTEAGKRSDMTPVSKHVDFTASTRFSEDDIEESPESPLAAEKTPSTNVAYPTLPPVTPPKASEESTFSFNVLNPTIRQVSFSEKPARSLPLPKPSPIPHGLVNKKRHRDEEDDTVQNSNDDTTQEEDKRLAKKARVNPPATPSKMKTPIQNKTRRLPQTTPRRSTADSSAHRKGMSMSRLSFLSRPKVRR